LIPTETKKKKRKPNLILGEFGHSFLVGLDLCQHLFGIDAAQLDRLVLEILHVGVVNGLLVANDLDGLEFLGLHQI
jgi:hypothetical protein